MVEIIDFKPKDPPSFRDGLKTWARAVNKRMQWMDLTARELTTVQVKTLCKLVRHGPIRSDLLNTLAVRELEKLGCAASIIVSKTAMPDVRLPFTRKLYTPGYIAATNEGEELYKQLCAIKRTRHVS